MSVETLPQYLSVSEDERGDSFGISWDKYRHLARSALAIIQQERLTMGLYKFDGGAALDIFGESNCLTLVVSGSTLFVKCADGLRRGGTLPPDGRQLRKGLAQTGQDRPRGDPSMTKTVQLIYNSIVGGKFYNAGGAIDLDILPENLRHYIVKPSTGKRPAEVEPHLSFELNRPYRLDKDGFLRGGPSPSRQAAEMAVQAEDEDALADELAEGEVSATVAAAMEEGRANYQDDVELQKAQVAAKLRRQEEAEDFIQEEKDEQLADGPRASSFRVLAWRYFRSACQKGEAPLHPACACNFRRPRRKSCSAGRRTPHAWTRMLPGSRGVGAEPSRITSIACAEGSGKKKRTPHPAGATP